MRLVNRYADPNCELTIPTWTPTTVQVAVTQDGRHWKYSLHLHASLIPEKMSDCLLMELTPASAWESICLENSDLLYSSPDGLKVADVSKEKRNFVGIQATVALEFTPIGMCFIELDEWPILREAGALVFAADTAPY